MPFPIPRGTVEVLRTLIFLAVAAALMFSPLVGHPPFAAKVLFFVAIAQLALALTATDLGQASPYYRPIGRIIQMNTVVGLWAFVALIVQHHA